MKRGFTLVEALIVIGIVGILIGVSAFSLSTLRSRARDAKRQADLRVIQAAFQQYYADQGFYPAHGSFQQGPPSTAPVTTLTSSTGNPNCVPAGNPNCPNPVRVYLSIVPVDPQLAEGNNSQHYCYQPQASIGNPIDCDNVANMCHYYSLFAPLETDTGNSYTCVDRLGGSVHVHSENFVVHPL